MWVFGDCELDAATYQLRRGGRPVKLEPRVFDVLLHLLAHRERVVSKNELLDAVWNAEAVSESVLPRCVAAARRAVGDDRTRQAVIHTVHGRGYRFVAAVAERSASETALPPEASPALALDHHDVFVGRAAAMTQLDQALGAALAGRGRVVLLAGEPGIGKTRTAEEFGRAARGRKAAWQVGRCVEGEGAPPFWPWVQVLRGCIADSRDADLAADAGAGAPEIAALVRELRDRIPALPEPPPLDAEQARFRLFDSVAGFLLRHARRRPLVVAIDDLHWADADSLRLFQHLAAGLRESPLLLLGSYRDVEVRRGHPLAELLGRLARERVERIALGGLDSAALGALIESISGSPPARDRIEVVAELTDGNPFFVHEVVRWLTEGGSAELAAGRAGRPWTVGLALPQGVRDALGRRLDSLSPECNALLRVAAVTGREFSTTLLAQVVDQPVDELLELLAEAMAAGLIEVRAGIGQYAFAHALTRQTLYEELSIPQRVRLHRSVGDALQLASESAPDPPLAELAHHYFVAAAGGDSETAIAACVAAAEHAAGLLAHEESARQLERALEALELELPVDEARRCELTLKLADALALGGDRDRARACYRSAAEHARRAKRADWLAEAAAGFRGFGEMGAPTDDETRRLLDEALEAVADTDALSRSRLLSRMVGAEPWCASMALRESMSQEALELALASGARRAITDALTARYWASLGPDRVDERNAVAQRMRELAREWGDLRLETLACEVRLGCDLVRGDLVAARADLEEFGALAERLRLPLFRFLASMSRGSVAMSQGRFAEAERDFGEAADRGRGAVPFSDLLEVGIAFWQQAARGDWAPTREVAELLTTALTQRFGGVEKGVRAVLALGLVRGGDVDAARREFEALSANRFDDLERDEHWLITMGALAALAVALEDRERGALLYERLLPYCELAISHDLLRSVSASVSSALGALATLGDRLDEGSDHFEHALCREREMALAPALCWTTLGYARLLERRDRPGDAERAAAMRREAEKQAEQMGLFERVFGASGSGGRRAERST